MWSRSSSFCSSCSSRRVTTSRRKSRKWRQRSRERRARSGWPTAGFVGRHQARQVDVEVRLERACACRGTPSPLRATASRLQLEDDAHVGRSTRRARRRASGSFRAMISFAISSTSVALFDRVRDRRDDDLRLAARAGLDARTRRAGGSSPARSRRSRASRSCAFEDLAAGREVGALDVLEQVLRRRASGRRSARPARR